MSETLTELGKVGSLQRPTYDPTTGVLTGTAKSFKMAIVPLASVDDLEGRFKQQRFAAMLSKKLMEAAGWVQGRPTQGDLVVADGQTLIVEFTVEKGLPDDIIYYCQCVG